MPAQHYSPTAKQVPASGHRIPPTEGSPMGGKGIAGAYGKPMDKTEPSTTVPSKG